MGTASANTNTSAQNNELSNSSGGKGHTKNASSLGATPNPIKQDDAALGQSEKLYSPWPKKLERKFEFPKKTIASLYQTRGDLFINFIGKVADGAIEYMTYKQVQNEALSFIQWILKSGFDNSENTKVAYIADNSLELRIISQAFCQSKIPIIPLYNALSEESIFDIIKSTEAQILVCDNDKKLKLIFSNIGILPNVKMIITTHNDCKFELPKDSKVAMKPYKECHVAKSEFTEIEQPEPEDLAYLLCTSGSTGNPKIVKHTHSSIFNTAICTAIYLNDFSRRYDENLSLYAMLPEAHMLGLISVLTITIQFGNIAYPSSRDLKAVMTADMAVVKPSVWTVVPLVLNRIRKTVNTELKKSFLKSSVFTFSYSLSASLGPKNPMGFVFNKIKNGMGGNVKLIVCAGALLDKDVQSFIETTTGAQVIQGFGMTEGFACLAEATNKGHHCGRPMLGMEIFLKDVPEMDYWSEKNQGEVCFKGDNLFSGYYNNEAETEKAIDSNGYMMSGDIGEIGPDGNLRIIDRKKNIFKLAQGEYICISAIQDAYLEFFVMKDVYIHGSPLESSLVGIGFFDVNDLKIWLKKVMSAKEYENEVVVREESKISIFTSQSVHNLLVAELNTVACGAKLKGFEKVKKWKFVGYLPSVENKLLTVTLKQKRAAFETKFRDDFRALYEELNAVSK